MELAVNSFIYTMSQRGMLSGCDRERGISCQYPVHHIRTTYLQRQTEFCKKTSRKNPMGRVSPSILNLNINPANDSGINVCLGTKNLLTNEFDAHSKECNGGEGFRISCLPHA